MLCAEDTLTLDSSAMGNIFNTSRKIVPNYVDYVNSICVQFG